MAGALACALVAFATSPPGPGLDPDAVSYVGSAVTLTRRGAYRVPVSNWTAADTTEPLAHFPPGFSTAIAIPIALGLPPLQAARLVVVLSAFFTASMLYLMVNAAAGPWVAAVVALTAAVTPALVQVHLSILSEPLFLATLIATLVAMLAVAERDDWHWRLILGVAAAAAVMVRYAGAAVIAAAALWVLVPRARWRHRLRDLALVSLPGALALGTWFTRATHEAGTTSVRRFATYGGLGASLREGAATIADWLAPGLAESPFRWVAAVSMLALVFAAFAGARTAETRARRVIGAALLMLTASATMLIVSRVAADPNIPFDERMLSPLILLAEIAILVAAAGWRGPVRWAGGAVLTLWLLASLALSVERVRYAIGEGNDFAGTDWRYSPTVDWVRRSGAGRTLYTNWPAALYFHAGRGSHVLPSVLDPLVLRRFGDRLDRNNGVIVAFDTPSPDAAPPDSIAGRLRLTQVARLEDGTIWASAPASSGDGRRAASGSP